MDKKEKKIIGRREKVGLPDWGLTSIIGKVDTGAYNCAIHTSYTRENTENEKRFLEFVILDPKDPLYTGQKIKTEQYRMKRVRNSFGQMESRYLVKTHLILFGETIEAGFTLSNRSNMKNSILIGRKILKGRFLVDVEKTNISSKSLKK